VTEFLARRETFDRVGSTNDVVRDWLAAGTPEVCLALASEQTAGRGRDGRSWVAPPGGALLLSLGFRPAWLEPDAAWRLAAVVSLAMAEAAEASAGLGAGTVRLKWPNDLVIDGPDGPRKLAGVLGETDGLGSPDPRVVVGLGINTAWAADAFPPALAGSMTSLAEAAGRTIDNDALLAAFIDRLEAAILVLRTGRFDGAAWSDRQLTTGRNIHLSFPDGSSADLSAVGVDPRSGALLVVEPALPDVRRHVFVGEIEHVRLTGSVGTGV
jgi:BirA family transcriptional regulator, biotin operon repressor / biotin---[acetyl-CoA-carboxylase] ligase